MMQLWHLATTELAEHVEADLADVREWLRQRGFQVVPEEAVKTIITATQDVQRFMMRPIHVDIDAKEHRPKAHGIAEFFDYR